MTAPLVGARWWKWDFHTHTPFSKDTAWNGRIGQADEFTPQQWLRTFMHAGVDCVVIADHNGGGWIDRLKSAYEDLAAQKAAGFRELFLFPGVELSVNGGFHVLAVFHATASTSDIDSLLGRVNYEGTKGDSDGCTAKSIAAVVEEIHRAGGVAIPAHVDQPKGLLQIAPGQPSKAVGDATTIGQALRSPHLTAMEVVTPGAPLPQVYADAKLDWTSVLGRDWHGRPSDSAPGSRFTWVKMGRPSLDGLRLALLDGAGFSALRSDEAPADPNRQPSLLIEEVAITEAKYAGRGAPLSVRFSPWLTALIGGRGTGKSTAIEALRLALDRRDELPEATKEQFERFATVSTTREHSGALTDATAVSVTLRKDGERFRVQWRQGSSGSLIEREVPEGQWVRASGEVRSRFPIRLFSQKQVFALADDPNALLRLVDQAPEVKKADWEQTWKETQARFLRLRSEGRELRTRISDQVRLEGELADISRQLAVFEEGDHSALLQRYQRSSRQRSALTDRESELTAFEKRIRSLASELVPSAIPVESFDAGTAADQSGLTLLTESKARQDDAVVQLTELADSLLTFAREWSERRSASEWAEADRQVTGEYTGLVERLQAEGIKDPTAYSSLVARRTELERRIADLESIRARAEELDQQAEQALADLEAARLDLSVRRKTLLAKALADNTFVQMDVVSLGADARAADQAFREYLGREDGRLEEDVKALLSDLYNNLPAEPARADEIKNRVRALKASLSEATSTGSLPGRSKWLLNHLESLQPERIDRLHLWWPEDGLRVRYRRSNSTAFVSIEQGSPGQKSAAILAFLLSYGGEPIVLDQPEDDLDNHLISDLIVQQIRESKKTRQVIVATHSSNIVVNGDAEMVNALDHRGGQCVVLAEGTGCLQEVGVRKEICQVMEGGTRAFRQRYRRINAAEEWTDV